MQKSRTKRDPTRYSFDAMLNRCKNPKETFYARYGGRGITVCERWSGPEGYVNFLADMGPRPDGKTLDRINNDGNYEPGNCKWSTRAEQVSNSTITTQITIDGRTQSIKDWSAETGIGRNTFRQRMQRGWSMERALTTPPAHGGPGNPRRTPEGHGPGACGSDDQKAAFSPQNEGLT